VPMPRLQRLLETWKARHDVCRKTVRPGPRQAQQRAGRLQLLRLGRWRGRRPADPLACWWRVRGLLVNWNCWRRVRGLLVHWNCGRRIRAECARGNGGRAHAGHVLAIELAAIAEAKVARLQAVLRELHVARTLVDLEQDLVLRVQVEATARMRTRCKGHGEAGRPYHRSAPSPCAAGAAARRSDASTPPFYLRRARKSSAQHIQQPPARLTRKTRLTRRTRTMAAAGQAGSQHRSFLPSSLLSLSPWSHWPWLRWLFFSAGRQWQPSPSSSRLPVVTQAFPLRGRVRSRLRGSRGLGRHSAVTC
jgi:hypothetical protein